MTQKILVTNFNFSVSGEEFKQMASQLAQDFANVPGCSWKIWLIDEKTKQAGAVYLFENETALKNFKESPLVASILSHPSLSNFDLKERDILEEESKITRAPLMDTISMHG